MNYSNAPDYKPQWGDLVELPNKIRLYVSTIHSDGVLGLSNNSDPLPSEEIEESSIDNCTLVRKASGEWMPGFEPRGQNNDDDFFIEKASVRYEEEIRKTKRNTTARSQMIGFIDGANWYKKYGTPLPTPPQGGKNE